eukprot:jgi/Psemu1/23053/gm1.23053_g
MNGSRELPTEFDEERTSRGKVIAQQKGLKWTKKVPQGKDYEPVKRDDSHLHDSETAFLEIGEAEPTHAYDVAGKWKLLYTKPEGGPIGPGLKPKAPPMNIFVRSWNGTIYHLEYVKPYDTIGDVQSRLEREYFIHREHQRLRLGKQPLSDPEETLEERDIQDGCTLDLDPMKIFIKEPNNKVKHILLVDPDETIDEIKDKIFRKIGLPKIYQRLHFEGHFLDDDRKTLDACGIVHQDTLDLEPMVITVRSPDGRSVDLVVNPADTIEDIKDDVEEELGIPVEDQMPAFKGIPLHDDSTLSDNKIQHRDVIDLQPMEIFVVDLNGEEWAYEVEPSYTIKSIKCQLEEDTGVKVTDQRLTFQGSILKNNKSTLKDAGIKHKDTLKLEPMKIKVRAIDGRTVDLVVEPEDKIEDIKWQVEKTLGIPIEDQLPAFRGKLVLDSSTLNDNKIGHGDVIDLQPIEIYVIDLENRRWTYVVNLTDSIMTVKDQLATDTGVQRKYQRLAFHDNLLNNDHSTLTNAGIQHKDTLQLRPMEIQVKAPDGRVTDLVVHPSDTIESIKRQVKKNLGIPIEDQLPSFRGASLCNDDSTLEENDINHGDVIDLQPMEIYVIDLDDKRRMYTVTPSTNIKTVKNYVENDTGVKRNHQRLTFQGTILNSDRIALKDAGIKHKDTLILEPMMIKVRDPDGRAIDLVVRPTDTIEDIKDRVEGLLGIPADDQLPTFRGYAIPANSTLDDNDIRHGDAIDLEATEIYVIDLADHKWTYVVSLADSIKSMKNRLAANTGVQREHQRLTFHGSLLDNNKISLKDAGIKHKDTLKLEPMKIKVKDPTGNTIELVVNPEDTIEAIKRQVENELGIPIVDQLPVFKGNPLHDNTTLEENDINHGDVIDLQPMEVYVIDLDETRWMYTVSPSTTITNIKNQVGEDTGVKREHQRLIFKGTLLDNDKSTLMDVGVKHRDTLKLEPMKIKVKAPDGRIADLEVSPNDTIEDVKRQVADELGIPVEDQLPTYGGSPLYDNNTLEQNGIKHGDVIDLQPMKIFVIGLDDERWTYEVNPSDSIKSIKKQVEEDTGVKRKHQRLSFKGTVLVNDKSTLKKSGIKHKDTLRLDPMEIKVRDPNGNTIDLVVQPEDTIEDVKRQVAIEVGIPVEDQLPAFRGSPLRDNSTLEQNGINHGDVIDLQPMELFVIGVDGTRWMYAVTPSTTIRTIKNQVEKDTGLKKKHQRLTFQGTLLDDDTSTLKSAGIKHRDTLKLEPMKIKVKALDGRVVDLVVRPKDTIEDVKHQVENELGIPVEDQIPAFRGNPLHDTSTLEENGINHGDVIDLEPMEIYVIDTKGKKKAYAVEPTDTIESLKYQVAEVTGVQRILLRMTFEKNLLEDDSSTLKDNGIKHKDTLQLEPFRVFVRLAGGKKIPFKVDPEATTPDDLKDSVEESEGIAPVDQILSYKGKKILDVKPLLDYGIRHGDTIDLRLQPPPKKKSYLPDDWKQQQQDRYGNVTVTTFKLNYSGSLSDSIVAGITKDTTDFKVEKPVLRSEMKAC